MGTLRHLASIAGMFATAVSVSLAEPPATGAAAPRAQPSGPAPSSPDDPKTILTAKPGTPLWADTLKEFRAFEHAVRLGAYDRVGTRQPALEARVRKALRQIADTCADPTNTNPPAMPAAFRQLVTAACTDPLVRACDAWLVSFPDHPAAATDLLKGAADAMRTSGYCAYLRALAVANVGVNLTANGRRDLALPYFTEAADLFVVALTDPAQPVFPLRHAYNRLSTRINDQFPPEVTRTICERLEAAGSDAWLVHMLWGRYFDRIAWDARGHGFANTVSKNGWDVFRTNQAKARARYEQAYATNAANPEAPDAMISIARYGLARPGQELDYWFRRAVEAQFDFPPAYSNVLYTLRPRWGGKFEEMLGFGVLCANTDRFDTGVPYQFIRSALDVCDELQEYQKIWQIDSFYQRAHHVLSRYLETDPADTQHRRALLAGIAWHAGKYQDAKKLLDQIRSTSELDTLHLVRADYPELKDDVLAFTGPGADLYKRAAEAASRADFAGARALAEQALEEAASSTPEIQSAARFQLAKARFNESYFGERWTDLTFDNGAPLWRNERGRWTPVSASVVRAEPAPTGGPLLRLRVPIGMRFEVKGTISFSAVKDFNLANAGFACGYNASTPGGGAWYGVSIFPASSTAGVQTGWPAQGDHPIAPATGPSEFEAICCDGRLRLSVNGRVAFDGPLPTVPGWIPGEAFAIGGRGTGFSGAVEFSNIRVRRLDDNAKFPVTANGEKQLKF